MHDLHEVDAIEVAWLVVQHRVQSRIGLDDPALQVDARDADGGPVENRPKAALALPQGGPAPRLLDDGGGEARDGLHQLELGRLDAVFRAPTRQQRTHRRARGVHGRGHHGNRAFGHRDREHFRITERFLDAFVDDRLAAPDGVLCRASQGRRGLPPVVGAVAPHAFPTQHALVVERDRAVVRAEKQARPLDDQVDGALGVGLAGPLPHQLGERLSFGSLPVRLGVKSRRLQ